MDINPHHYDQDDTKRGGWKSAIFIIFVEMAERFAYYGIAGNLIMYLTTVIGQPVAEAAKNVNSLSGVSSLSLLIGAFAADSYLGRFKTTLVSSCIFLMGLILLTISTSTVVSHGNRTTVFFIALYITAIGDGGHKPCVQTFAADQFDEETPEQKKEKSSFFNWWYLGIAIGACTAVLVVVYVEDRVSWTVGFTIPTVAVGVALVVFLVGSSRYRKERPVGSPFTRVAQVIVASVRKRNVSDMSGEKALCWDEDNEVGTSIREHKLGRTKQFRYSVCLELPIDKMKLFLCTFFWVKYC